MGLGGTQTTIEWEAGPSSTPRVLESIFSANSLAFDEGALNDLPVFTCAWKVIDLSSKACRKLNFKSTFAASSSRLAWDVSAQAAMLISAAALRAPSAPSAFAFVT